jgi:hypothetical protein
MNEVAKILERDVTLHNACAPDALMRLVRVATKSTLHEQPDDLEYWLGVPMSERVAAVEILRQRVFGGVHGARQGLQRVCCVIHRS